MNIAREILDEIDRMEDELIDEWNDELAHQDDKTEYRMDIIESKSVMLDRVRDFILEKYDIHHIDE